jgi:hypothetical protein
MCDFDRNCLRVVAVERFSLLLAGTFFRSDQIFSKDSSTLRNIRRAARNRCVRGQLVPLMSRILAEADNREELRSRPRKSFGRYEFLYLVGLAAAILFDHIGVRRDRSSVDHQGRSGYIARLGRGQKRSDARDFLGLAKAAGGQVAGDWRTPQELP